MKVVRKMRKKKSFCLMCIGTEVVLSYKDMIILIQRNNLKDKYSLIYNGRSGRLINLFIYLDILSC